MNKSKPKTKFFASKAAISIAVLIFASVLAIWIGVFIVFLQDGNEITSKQEMGWIVAFVTLIIIVLIIDSLLARRNCFYVYEINEKGIKRSLFKRFRKIEMDWDEIHEMKCYEEANVVSVMFSKYNTFWLVISKTELKETFVHQILKRNDVICFVISRKNYNMIRTFTDKEILNLPAWIKDNQPDVD